MLQILILDVDWLNLRSIFIIHKILFIMRKIFLGILLLSIGLVNSQEKEKRFEVQYLNVMKAEKDGKCFQPSSSSQVLIDLETPSDVRYKMRSSKSKKVGDGKKIKKEVLYKYIKKNFWIVVVDHVIRDSDCSSGEQRKRELISIVDEFQKLYGNDENTTLEEAIEKKIKSSVFYLWWKNDRYIRFEIKSKSQPYTDDNETDLLKWSIEKLKSHLKMNYTEEERKKLFIKHGGSVGGVRG